MALAYIPMPASGYFDPTSPAREVFQNGIPLGAYVDDADEAMRFDVQLPPNYASGLVAKIQGSMDAANTSDKVELEVSVMATTPDNSEDVSVDSFAADNVSSFTVADAAGDLIKVDITLTNDDGAAAGDNLIIRINRDGADATNDTAVGDWLARPWLLQYTTT